jgi:hypothetical protein
MIPYISPRIAAKRITNILNSKNPNPQNLNTAASQMCRTLWATGQTIRPDKKEIEQYVSLLKEAAEKIGLKYESIMNQRINRLKRYIHTSAA